MGKLPVTLGVRDQQGSRFEDIEATRGHRGHFHGHTQSLAPEAGGAGGALSPVPPGRRQYRPGGHRLTMIRIEDQTFPTRVTFAEENLPILLGVVTLEEALLAVDPVEQQLVPVDAMRL